ncbi:MAG: hypothetical protein DCO81_07430 [Candidatus Aquiluna sp. XM-24bin5]|nr:MAG: hypothetical protein DCO81_07430 [Candidatus Aquiluna sp. XM-24bin5]
MWLIVVAVPFHAFVTGRLRSSEIFNTETVAKPFEWPAAFSSLILFPNEGVADFSGHRVLSRIGILLLSVVGAVAATLWLVLSFTSFDFVELF